MDIENDVYRVIISGYYSGDKFMKKVKQFSLITLSIIMVAMVSLLPLLLLYFLDLKVLPLMFLLGISGPGFLCAALYSETFKKFEPKEEQLSEEEELENAIKKVDDENQQ